jgi:hypothetical protein
MDREEETRLQVLLLVVKCGCAGGVGAVVVFVVVVV